MCFADDAAQRSLPVPDLKCIRGVMVMIRHMFCLLMLTLVVMTGFSATAMASNEIEHQMHCAQGDDVHAKNIAPINGHAHGSEDMSTQHATPGHDHDTCVIHACAALSAEKTDAAGLNRVLLTALSWPEASLPQPVHIDNLQRPPRT